MSSTLKMIAGHPQGGSGPADEEGVSASSTVVPANRLGQLLAEARLRIGVDLPELSTRSSGLFTVGELSDLEAGHRVLDEELIARVTRLYELDCGPIIPQRAELTIDLSNNMLSAAGRAIPLETVGKSHILDRYLSLVYVLRNREPGAEVPLREEDLAILAASLAERSELIEEQLLFAMHGDRVEVRGLIAWFRKRLWVPGAGAVVGAVSLGTLVMVGSGPSAEARSELPEPEPEPGRSPNGADDVGAPSRVVAAPGPSSPTNDLDNSSAVIPGAAAITATTAALSEDATPAEIGAVAEALLPFDWKATLPGWTITYMGPRDGYRGLTFPYDTSIEMYVRPGDSPEFVAGILAHELGHAIDVTHLDGDDRDAWLEARDRTDAQWWPDAFASDFETGAGDFAEGFAYWALADENSSRLAGTPDQLQIDAMIAIVSPHLR
ncbi:MAG: hypothetical protein ACR2P0_16885 [Acidimicrobiales bacterium]